MEETQDKQPEEKKKWIAEEAYRDISDEEVDMFFAFYDKHNGNINQMVLDKDFTFKAYSQTRYYCVKYDFKTRLVETRRKRADEVIASLHDSKIRAIENAQRLLSPKHRFVYSKTGMQIFDTEGNPLIVEDLPYYKEIKTAWDIIKAELGEPTNITRSNFNLDPQINEIEITIKRNET
jgi:hypothetical protein